MKFLSKALSGNALTFLCYHLSPIEKRATTIVYRCIWELGLTISRKRVWLEKPLAHQAADLCAVSECVQLPLQLWAGLSDCLIRGPQTYRPLKGWKVPSSESWWSVYEWQRKREIEEEIERKKRKRGMASVVYPTAPLPVSKVAWTPIFCGAPVSCSSCFTAESLFFSKDQDTNESVQSWKVISIFPSVLIFIAMKF